MEKKLNEAIDILNALVAIATENRTAENRDAVIESALCAAIVFTSSYPHRARDIGMETLKYGKFQNDPIDDVPLWYLKAICADNQVLRIRGYLQSEAVRSEKEHVRCPNHTCGILAEASNG